MPETFGALLASGTLLENRYRIRTLLGQGGMSRVYLADAIHLGVLVAVKENLQDSVEARSQFEREAQILARLSHPNIPRVIDRFTDSKSGQQYLVMEYVDGEDLATMIRRTGALPEATVIIWIRQILDAVEYLHHQQPQVIHRDIKPANIKITPQGKAVLVDFGISKFYDPTRGTMTGLPAVTAGYAPPEQYGFKTTERSDIYALGATLYTMLTGRVPPDAPLRQAGEEVLAPPHQFATISPQIEKVILRAMEVQTTERWQTAGDLRAALEGHALAKPDAGSEAKTVLAPKQNVPITNVPVKKSSSPNLLIVMGAIIIGLTCLCGVLFGVSQVRSNWVALSTRSSPTPIIITATPLAPTATRVPDAIAEFRVDFRTGPGNDFDTMGMLEQGEGLKILGQYTKPGPAGNVNWLLVSTESGKQGWVEVKQIKTNIPIYNVPFAAQIPNTPTPRATATPAVRLLLKDDFSDTLGKWARVAITDTDRSFYYESGEYHIVAKKQSVYWTSRAGVDSFTVDQGGFDNFSFQVQVRRAEGTNGDYGLIFRERIDTDSKNDAYFFMVDAQAGSYKLVKLIQGEWTTLVDWTKSLQIHAGDSMNAMKVTCQGNQITIFANGQQLATFTDTTFPKGKVGMFVEAYKGETNYHAVFDNLEVWSLP
jgi:serine/threonine protein kinase